MRSAFAYKQQNFVANADQNFLEKKFIIELSKIDPTPLKINFCIFRFFSMLRSLGGVTTTLPLVFHVPRSKNLTFLRCENTIKKANELGELISLIR